MISTGFGSCLPCSPRYFRILVTTPAPTVRPPSRIAKRSCSSIAIGVISSIVIFVLFPAIAHYPPPPPHPPSPPRPPPPLPPPPGHRLSKLFNSRPPPPP